ncbi:MAG: hypothetical protein ACE5JR_00925 [Gemmatimonadota bacterium]
MNLHLDEIRHRIERLRRALREEELSARREGAGALALAPLYGAHRLLAHPDAIPTIERELAEAEGVEEERLRRTLEWAAEHHVRRAGAPLDDEYAQWEGSATITVGSREIPFQGATAAVAETEDRCARRQLEEARLSRLEEVIPLQLDRLDRWRGAIEELGYGGPVEAWERVTGCGLAGLLQEARRIVRDTEEVYWDQLRFHLERRLGVPVAAAEAHDARRLHRLPWFDRDLGTAPLLGAVRADLASLGVPLEAEGRVELSVTARPRPGDRSVCVPLEVPERIVLLLTPGPSHGDRSALLAAIGRALHAAYTAPELPFEYRVLGDPAVAYAHASSFAQLLLTPTWVRRAGGVEEARAREYVRMAAFLDLAELRSRAVRLEFGLELRQSEHPADLGARWAELHEVSSGFRGDPRGYLEMLDAWFEEARWLRGRMLSALLLRRLRDRYDEDWFRNPRAGHELRGWFEEGTLRDAAHLAARLDAPRLDAEALLESVVERLE